MDNSQNALCINELQGEEIPAIPMEAAEFSAICATLGIKASELAAWEGVTPRAARFWLSGKRPIPGGLALLVRLLSDQPWLLLSARRIASAGASSRLSRARVL